MRIEADHAICASIPVAAIAPEDQARLWLERPAELLETCHRKFGDLFVLELGKFGRIVIIADPAFVREVLRLPADLYECRPFNEGYRYAMGGHALFLQDGENHRRLKKAIAPLFRAETLSAHAATVAEVTRQVVRTADTSGPVRLRPLMHEITFRSLLRLVFGRHADWHDELSALFRERVWSDLRAWKPWTALSRQQSGLRAIIAREAAARRGRPGGDCDLLSDLLAARDETGTPLTDAELQDQVLMMTITAGDAVAVAASWAVELMARNPAAQDRLRLEAGSDAGGGTGMPPYREVVWKEVLRLYPVLPTVSGRRLRQTTELCGRRFGAGITLAPCGYLANRDPQRFPDPLTFRPERFFATSPEPFAFFPFGGGLRACLGSALAPLSIGAILDCLCTDFRISPAADTDPDIVRHGTLLAPAPERAVRLVPATASESRGPARQANGIAS